MPRSVATKPTLLMSLMNQAPFQSRRFYRRYDRLVKDAGVSSSPQESYVDTRFDETIADPNSMVAEPDIAVYGGASPYEEHNTPLAERAEMAAEEDPLLQRKRKPRRLFDY